MDVKTVNNCYNTSQDSLANKKGLSGKHESSDNRSSFFWTLNYSIEQFHKTWLAALLRYGLTWWCLLTVLSNGISASTACSVRRAGHALRRRSSLRNSLGLILRVVLFVVDENLFIGNYHDFKLLSVKIIILINDHYFELIALLLLRTWSASLNWRKSEMRRVHSTRDSNIWQPVSSVMPEVIFVFST